MKPDKKRAFREKYDGKSPENKNPDGEVFDGEISEKENSDWMGEPGEGEAAAVKGGKKLFSKAKAKIKKRESQEDEGEDWEEDDGGDWGEEEPDPSKPWAIVLVFLGMVVAAAVICILLWSFTHHGKPGEGNQKTPTAAPGSVSGSVQGGSQPSGAGKPSTGSQGGNPASTENPGEPGQEDLNQVVTQDGRIIVFTECDDFVTPKEYVNLRTEPSTAQGEATVGCTLNQGEKAHRTGISEEMGWSRVEYNGQVLYVVTSFVNVVGDGSAD